MFKSFILSNQIVLLFFIISLASLNRFSQATSIDNLRPSDMTDLSSNEVDDQRRTYDYNQLRYFLLTSNAKQLAAKREQQTFHKRQLIHEYLQSINDPDRLQEVKKRFTYCSVQDILHGSLCRRRAIHY